MCWATCRHTTVAAAKRQCKSAPTPNPTIADDFVKHSIGIIEKELGEDLDNFGYSVVDWYNHLDTKKQQQITHAINYYRGDLHDISKQDMKKLLKMRYSSIVKEELQKIDGKPRMVCAIPQRAKYIMGPVTWALEEICAKKLNGYCGNQNLTEMQEKINHYLSLGFTTVVEGDGSAFDNTQDVTLKELDRYIYRRLYNKIYHVPLPDFIDVSQALTKDMNVEIIENGRRKVLLSYSILGTVFSGDCDTTLMNTIRMAMYNRYVNDKAGLVYGQDYICFSKGDDFTVMYKPYVKDTFVNKLYYDYFCKANPDPSQPDTRIYGLGQVLKFLTFADASSLTFCSLRAWWLNEDETRIYLTRDPSKFFDLAKYSRKVKGYSMVQRIIYLQDQAQALEVNYPNVTIFSYYAEQYRKLASTLSNLYGITDQKILYSRMQQQQRAANARLKRYVNNYVISQIMDYLEQLEEENAEVVGHREVQYKIQGDYWDFMKSIVNVQNYKLTPDEAKLVNQQIENEFYLGYLKSMIDVGQVKAF